MPVSSTERNSLADAHSGQSRMGSKAAEKSNDLPKSDVLLTAAEFTRFYVDTIAGDQNAFHASIKKVKEMETPRDIIDLGNFGKRFV